MPTSSRILAAIRLLLMAGLFCLNLFGPPNPFAGALFGQGNTDLPLIQSIQSQPLLPTVSVGAPVTLSVTATSTLPLTYEWRVGGVKIKDAVGASYTLSSAQLANAGRYDVIVRNAVGSSSSSVLTLVVLAPPTISVQPANVTVLEGAPAKLSVTAEGTGLTYQWYRVVGAGSLMELTGETAAVYMAPSGRDLDGSLYCVKVSNGLVSVTSASAAVRLGTLPTITASPEGVSAALGGSATFRVLAEGGLTYQWRKAGVNITGGTGSSYSISPVVAGSAAMYDVVVTNAVGSVASYAAVLEIASLPSIVFQSGTLSVSAGGPAVMEVGASGAAPLSYQWFKAASATGAREIVSGATAARYQIAGAESVDVGFYSVDVTNAAGTVTSASLFVSVVAEGGVSIREHPLGGSVLAGEPYTFSVGVTDTAPVSYQWRKGGVSIAGGTAATYSIASAQAADVGVYDVVVRNAAGSSNSVPAALGLASAVSVDFQHAPYCWTTLAGVPAVSGTANGSGRDARFNSPSGVALGAGGTLYVSDSENSVIRKITAGGVVTTFAGVFATPGLVDGAALTAQFNAPQGIVLDRSGTLLVADSNNNVVRKISAQGQVTTLGVTFDGPRRVATDPTGNVYVLDNFTLQKVSPSGTATVLMGDALGAADFFPLGMAVDKNGRLFVAAFDGGAVYILKRNDAGGFERAGLGPYDFAVSDLTFGAGGNLYAASGNSVFFLGDTTLANLPPGLPASLMDADSSVIYPGAIAVDLAGTIFGVDPYNFIVFRGAMSLPALLTQPAFAANSPSTLGILAVGEGLTYQWLKDGTPIQGANTPELKIPSAQLSDPGKIQVIVSNSSGSVTSLPAAFSGFGPLFISSQPSSLVVDSGDRASFTVVAAGQSPFTYQWRKGGVAIAGATAATYSLDAAQVSDVGSYDVLVKSPTNAVGILSKAASLQVNIPAKVFSQPESLVLELGAKATFNVAASGTAPLAYQWSKNGIAIPGATLSSFSIASVGSGDEGAYAVVVRNGAGVEQSEPATLSVCIPARITASPQNTSARAGQRVIFSVAAEGTGPLSYQWRRGGLLIAGATSASYSIAAVEVADAGLYDVVVSNLGRSVSSAVAELVVETPVQITANPSNISAAVGAQISFTVSATGTGPISYQWRKGGVAIQGGTQRSLLLTAAPGDAGNYDVVVSNGFSLVVSSPAALTVEAGRSISILQPPPKVVALIQGTNASLKLAVDAQREEMLRTTFRVLNAAGQATGIAGTVPESGLFSVPLRSLVSAGTYRVELSREYKFGEALPAVNMEQFQVVFKGLETSAGSYELLLEDTNGMAGDSAIYRGLLLVTVNKTGTMSGRLLYNEATALAPLEDPSLRTYAPVTRSFSGSFTPSDTDPLKLLCVPKTGTLALFNKQELQLELDFSGDVPQLNAFVRDRASLPDDEDGLLSAAAGGTKLLTKIATEMAGVVGRYTLVSNSSLSQDGGPGADNNAYILVQVLPTGRLLWTSRQSASPGSGSAGLSLQAGAKLVAQFYEGRAASSTNAYSSTSLLGLLSFSKPEAVWKPSLSAGYGEGQLERQSSYVSKSNKIVTYDSLKFDPGSAFSPIFNWTGVKVLEFGEGACAWNGTAKDWLKFFGNSSVVAPVLYLTAEDPAGEGGVFTWSITLSSSGVIKTAPYVPGGSLQPVLSLRLDRSKGEWTGFYLPSNSKVRRTLFGASVRTQDPLDPLRAGGWVELGVLPALRTSAWKLENTAP